MIQMLKQNGSCHYYRQTKLDCDLLEEQGIMDYSLLIGLQVKESSSQGVIYIHVSYFSLYLLVQVFHSDVDHVSDHNKSLLTGSVDGVNPVYGSFTPPCK